MGCWKTIQSELRDRYEKEYDFMNWQRIVTRDVCLVNDWLDREA